MAIIKTVTDSITGMFDDNGKDYKLLFEEAPAEKNL
jgi:hypothetical protein